jgi:hypothetical protein
VITLGSATCIIGEMGSPSPGAGGMGGVVAGLGASGVEPVKILNLRNRRSHCKSVANYVHARELRVQRNQGRPGSSRNQWQSCSHWAEYG